MLTALDRIKTVNQIGLISTQRKINSICENSEERIDSSSESEESNSYLGTQKQNSFSVPSNTVVPYTDDDGDGKFGRLNSDSKLPNSDSKTDHSKHWRKLKIATKLVNTLGGVQDDLRVYGADVLDDDLVQEIYQNVEAHRQMAFWYILLPDSRIRRVWEILLIMLLLYIVVTVPIRVCFDVTLEGGAASFDSFVDALFVTDLFVNFICAYIDQHGVLIVGQQQIIKHYAQTWLFLDLIASVPIDSILEATGGDYSSSSNGNLNRVAKIARLPRLFRLIRLLRLLKLLRVVRLVRVMNNWERNYSAVLNVGFTRIFKVVFGVFMVTHLIGCFWYFMAWIGDDSPGPLSWVVRHGIQDESVQVKYLTSVYWAFSTLTTVGFGDISAYTTPERIFSILCMVAGVSWYAFIISTISSIISLFDKRNVEIKRKQRLIVEFMRQTQVPLRLRQRILSYFDYVTEKDAADIQSAEMESVLGMLSLQLRTEVTLHLNRDIIPNIPFFENKTPQFVAACVSYLRPLFFQPGDFISKLGQHPEEVFFLTSGRANLILPSGRNFRAMISGSYFGEIGCMLSEVNKVSVCAVTECEVYSLTKTDLKTLLIEYPDIANEMRKTANAKIERLNVATPLNQGRTRHSVIASFPGVTFDDKSSTKFPGDDFEEAMMESKLSSKGSWIENLAGDSCNMELCTNMVQEMRMEIEQLKESNYVLHERMGKILDSINPSN